MALRAAEVLVRYGRDRRRERAEAGRPPVESPTGDARAPAVPDPVPRPTAGHTPKPPTGAFRAVPDLPPGRLAELVRGG